MLALRRTSPVQCPTEICLLWMHALRLLSVHNASTLLFQGGGLAIEGYAQVTMTHCNVYKNEASHVSASTGCPFQCPTEISLAWMPADLVCAVLCSG